jgi:putative addiction module component (TIGR02574 family)
MSELTTNRLIEQIESLPVDDRIRVVDSVLKTLNPVDQEIEDDWIEVAENRLRDLKSGNVISIPGEDVFERVQKRFSG